MRRSGLLLFLLLLAWAAGTGWWFRGDLAEWSARKLTAVPLLVEARPEPDAETYRVLVEEMERWRNELAARHAAARTRTEREEVERDARIILEKALPAMMRCWLGTPWDFNGTAKAPGEGKVACGYFVATVLRDAGFKLDRYRLAQQPSENILRTFLPRNACVLTVGKPYDRFADELALVTPGIYIVGLDTHVAFLVIGEGGFRFIHSSGSRPWCVVDEGREEAEVLRKSNWRMLGNLTADQEVMRLWLGGQRIPVRGA